MIVMLQSKGRITILECVVMIFSSAVIKDILVNYFLVLNKHFQCYKV
jgi:hypothetical protein